MIRVEWAVRIVDVTPQLATLGALVESVLRAAAEPERTPWNLPLHTVTRVKARLWVRVYLRVCVRARARVCVCVCVISRGGSFTWFGVQTKTQLSKDTFNVGELRSIFHCHVVPPSH